MSGFSRDKCTKQELSDFKKEVITWLKNYGIDTDKLDIRGYQSYNGDVKIFTGDYMEFTNKKSSFSREEARKDEKGNVVGYEGTRGHHTTKLTCPIVCNRDEWDFFKESVIGEDRDYYDDFRKLEKLKFDNVADPDCVKENAKPKQTPLT